MNLEKCPACQSARYHGVPAGYLLDGKRCEVCTGHGVTTRHQIMGWELSL